jgi:multiple sugar transport system permease protein
MSVASLAHIGRPRLSRARLSRESLTGWLFATPIIVFVVVMVYLPIISAFVISLSDWNGVGPLAEMSFIGFDQYAEASRDPVVLLALRNTIVYSLIVVSSGMVFGLLLSVAVHSIKRGSGLVRAIYFMPYMLPMTAMALLWGLLYQPAYGLINQTLQAVGLPTSKWIYDTEMALPSIAFMVIWKTLGFYMIIFLAGLNAVPEEYYEASKIDGAGALYRFWHITVPLMKPTILFMLIIGVIDSMQVFTPVFVLTQGGPLNVTETSVYYMYLTAFRHFRFSYSCVQAMILFVVMLVITLLQLRLFREGGVTSYYR